MTTQLPPRLEGKIAVVAGGGSRNEGIGTGRAASILFARHGAKVLVVDRSIEAAEATVAAIRDDGGTAIPFAADLTSEADAQSVADAVVGEWGRLDILLNNIGTEGRGNLLEAPAQSWDAVWALNVMTIVTVSRALIPAMVEAGGGSIINTSSISALRPNGAAPYATAKGAVIALTTAMASDHGAQGIRVNCIAPGPIYTPMVTTQGLTPEKRELRRKASVLGIEGDAWDVGHAAVFLASDEARYITGVLLPVDGGVTIRGPER